ncbi:MAG: MFS transporter [Burkholderiaceae bacterium]
MGLFSPLPPAPASAIDSRQAAWRLFITLLLMTFGSSGMYVSSVVMPQVQADFGISRAAASMPYTLMMLGFGVGGMLMGHLSDRRGIAFSLAIGALGVGSGYILAGMTQQVWLFMLINGLLLGFLGISATFAPLVADTSLWWNRRRGIAVAICASGNYLAGALWPPLTQVGVDALGWRTTYLLLGVCSMVGMGLLALQMRQRPPEQAAPTPPLGSTVVHDTQRPFGLSTRTAHGLLWVAGLACCVAMSMPQVHIVSYCTDLGFGAVRGAEMLSLMLASGIVSRLVSGIICDRIGGLKTLILGSVLQGVALFLFLPFDGMVALYIASALFGLVQGGIVPSYAIIIREHFSPKEAGSRVGSVIMATLVGMALGGWMSGKIFDLTGSYHAAFINGIAWNLLNLTIAVFLYWRYRRSQRSAAPGE